MGDEYSYLNFFKDTFNQQNRISVSKIDHRKDLHSWKKELYEKLYEILGMGYLKEIGANYQGENRKAELLEEVKEDGYTRKKYRIETLPHVFMPFHVLIPHGVMDGKKQRTIIAIPAHGANKDTVAGVVTNEEVRKKLEKTPKESYGLEFVKRGYVVLCPDPPGYGERIERTSKEDKAFLSGKQVSVLSSSCTNLAQTAEALGLSFQGLVLWDMMRLVDFAIDQPYIDGERIASVGFSGGGLYTLWLSAMDERIKLAVISGYIHGFYDSILETHLCPCNYLPKLWQWADICDIASMIAPRFLYMENGTSDTLNGPRGILDPKEQVEIIRKVYQICGKEENAMHIEFEGIHEWYGGCFEFLDKYL